MAVTRLTLREARRLVNAVGRLADDATRTMAARWLRSWEHLQPLWLAAANDLLAARAASADGTLTAIAMQREARLRLALQRTRDALGELAGYAGQVSARAAGDAARATLAGHPVVMASQLPVEMREAAARGYVATTSHGAIDAMVARTAQTIHALTLPLPDIAIAVMQRVLVETIALGLHPDDSARTMTRRLRDAYDLSLTRATNIARTEVLDAYRRTGALVEQANSDVLSGWRWMSALDRRTCPGCWSKHGTLYPTATPGPWDHQQGRCARVPELRPWGVLGIAGDEPQATDWDARKVFNALPRGDQLAVMGRERLALLDSDKVTWGDLSIRRHQDGWRDSFVARPVRDLTIGKP